MARHVQITQYRKFAEPLQYSQILPLGSKVGPELPIMFQKEVFWTLIKIESLILAGITFKRWIILSSVILCKPHVEIFKLELSLLGKGDQNRKYIIFTPLPFFLFLISLNILPVIHKFNIR